MSLRFISFLLVIGIFLPAKAGEGMWIPSTVDSLRLREMQQLGLKLGAGEIYSIDHPSLKDAVVIFGGGCTAEIISPAGLLITNHHCGFSRIQGHSTLQNNYLKDGFWAANREKELPNPGLTVSFLLKIVDVTDGALKDVNDQMTEQQRSALIMTNVVGIRKNIEAENLEIKSFYFGSRYYLFVYDVFRDIRLVGAPPESIGRFGGDTDNWIWPRHTGDFSLFRVYADKNNRPADYSVDNIPYIPAKYLPLCIDGVKEGDFTMILGYPGKTDEYLTADALSMIAEKSLPAKTRMRTLRLEGLKAEMNKSATAELKYASKYVGISNAWKKWIGVTRGVEHSDAVNGRRAKEEQFERWSATQDTEYNGLTKRLHDAYGQYEPFYVARDLGSELLNSIEIFNLARTALVQYYSLLDSSKEYNRLAIEQMKKTGLAFFRSGLENIDRSIIPELLQIYSTNTDDRFHPLFYQTIQGKYKNDYKEYVENIFATSVFTDSLRYVKALKKSPKKIHALLWSDPIPAMYRDFAHMMLFNVQGKADSLDKEVNRLYRIYFAGLQLMEPERILYPDANFTMRVTYGKVEGYKPADGIDYLCSTTLDGVMEKEDTSVEDYHVFPELKNAYDRKDFGRWSSNGKMPVCFLASNHTSGGNSGSPVLNGNGELVGINFDRNWEGTVSDYVYDPTICRNISLDVRYVLFIIDKIGHAPWLIDELTLVKR